MSVLPVGQTFLSDRENDSSFSSSSPSSFPLKESLAQIPARFEKDFLEIGNTLQTVYSDAMTLNSRAQDTVGCIGGKSGENLLSRVGVFAKDSLANVKECRKEVSLNLENVNRIAGYLNDLYRMCSDIEKTAMFLKVVGLNIGVESTRSVESEEMFTVIAQEIRTLSGRIMTTAVNIRKDSAIARKSQMSAHKRIKEGLAKLDFLADEAQIAVQGALKEINHLTEGSVEMLENVGIHSKNISDLMAEIVVGIQYHDRMRQNINSIIEHFQMPETETPGGESAVLSGKSAADQKSLYHILSGYKEGVDGIIYEVNDIFQKSNTAFSNIGVEIGALVENLSGVGSRDTVFVFAKISAASGFNTAGLAPFETLKTALQHLHGLLDKGNTLVEQTRIAAIDAFETSSRLSTHVKDVRGINFATHMKALNAIIKAAHLGGEGRTLEVLAQEMKRASDQSNIYVGHVERIIGSISSSVDKLQSKNRLEKEEQEAADIKNQLGNGIADISEAYSRFSNDSADIFKRSERLGDTIRAAKEELSFLSALSQQLTAISNQLQEKRNALNVNVAIEIPLTVHDHANTIDKPEEIQIPIEEARQVRKSEPEKPVKKGSGEEDLGDNVELF